MQRVARADEDACFGLLHHKLCCRELDRRVNRNENVVVQNARNVRHNPFATVWRRYNGKHLFVVFVCNTNSRFVAVVCRRLLSVENVPQAAAKCLSQNGVKEVFNNN